MDQTIQTLFKSRRVNKKKILSALNKELDHKKRNVFENMKHEFMAHLSDRQSEMDEKHRKTVNTVRQQFQSLLMQIPSNVQNLTLADIASKGGSIEVIDGQEGAKQITIQIPKTLISSANYLPQVMAHKNRNDILKDTIQKTASLRSGSLRKPTERTNSSRVMTRSALKTTVNREVITRDKIENKKLETIPKTSTAESLVSPQKETLLKRLGIPKPPRRPAADENVVTLAFSTTGTPLAIDQAVQRVNNN